MPDVLWPLFQRNRHLPAFPFLAAQVLQQWARQKYGIRLMIVVIPHTFGRHLNFNCHLHILVSEGGLREATISVRCVRMVRATLTNLGSRLRLAQLSHSASVAVTTFGLPSVSRGVAECNAMT